MLKNGVLLLSAVLAEEDVIDVEFQKYVSTFGKSYTTPEEYELHKNLFRESHKAIGEVNSRNDVTFHLGYTFYSDWEPEEYRKLLGTWDRNTKPHLMLQQTPTNAFTFDT